MAFRSVRIFDTTCTNVLAHLINSNALFLLIPLPLSSFLYHKFQKDLATVVSIRERPLSYSMSKWLLFSIFKTAAIL